jgi:hypothetical protein
VRRGGDRHAAAFDREAWSRRANEIRARLPVSSVVGRVVELKKAGPHEWKGLCPFHNERTPSFTVNDKKGFYHCFGCGAHDDAIAFVMQRQGLAFQAAIELLESEGGLRHLQAARPAPPPPKARQAEDVSKAAAVARIWAQSQALEKGGAVDRYLRGRCIVPPAEYGFGDPAANAGWPVDIRFHGALWHGTEKRELPGMVAAFRRHDGSLAAVHRTYLKITGTGVTKAGTDRDKAHFGDRLGSFIRLAPNAEAMLGGEGIETTLSAMQLFRRAGIVFGAANAMATVEPPFECSDFIYAADWAAHNRVGETWAWRGAKAYGTGRRMRVLVPNLRHLPKADFNDYVVVAASSPPRGDDRQPAIPREERVPAPLRVPAASSAATPIHQAKVDA